MASNTVTTPDFTGVVDRSFFLAPLGGPQHPQTYLDRFPDSLYNKAIDSHLVKFMYSLLGPAGIGWLRKNYLTTRLVLEDYGVELFDLDKFYADPLSFTRILEEQYDEDPRGLLPREDWERIRVRDAKYRNRALDFVAGARAGNTPKGMYLVARSGLGHEVEIIENYRYLYDIHSDDPMGLPYKGTTVSTEEMIVLPRKEIPQSEVQVITITGSPTGGTFALYFPMGTEVTNTTAPIAYNATRDTIQQFLDALPALGRNNTRVTGGPLPDVPIRILFTGKLAGVDVPSFQTFNSLTGGTGPLISVSTERSGNNSSDETVSISARDQRYLQSALDRIKPVTAIVTYGSSPGLRKTQVWNEAASSSVYQEVVRYVTGRNGVLWPARDSKNWIEAGVEHEGQRAHNDLQHHYHGLHNVATTYAYTDAALNDASYATDVSTTAKYRSEHLGQFLTLQRALFPVLVAPSNSYQFTADQAIADFAEPLTVSSTLSSSDDTIDPLINGIYPVRYRSLPGVPEVKYKNDQFWSSLERATGSEFLEIDLGRAQAVNYLIFETTQKPFDIEIAYDVLDGAPGRDFRTVKLSANQRSTTSLTVNPQAVNKWFVIENYFTAPDNSMIFTRFIRIKFARRSDINSPFVTPDGSPGPYSIDIRNLRLGRNVS